MTQFAVQITADYSLQRFLPRKKMPAFWWSATRTDLPTCVLRSQSSSGSRIPRAQRLAITWTEASDLAFGLVVAWLKRKRNSDIVSMVSILSIVNPFAPRPHFLILPAPGQVRAIHTEKKQIMLQDGRRFSYGKCLIATGSRAVSLRHIDASVKDRVFTLRTFDEWKALREATLEGSPTVTIVGGGYLGTELASSIAGAAANDARVVQILPDQYPMNQVFPEFLGRKVSENNL